MTSNDKQAQRPKSRHHTVMRAYLDRFSDSGKLAAIPVSPDKKHHYESVTNATVEKDFYTIAHHPSGGDFFETAMNADEEDGIKVIRDLSSTGTLGHDDRYYLSRFMALHLFRSKRFRAETKYFLDKWGERPSSLSDEQIEDAHIEAAKESTGMIVAQEIVRAATVLSARPWKVVSDENLSLSCSDNPVLLIGDDPNLPYIQMTDRIWSAKQVILPLGRREYLSIGAPESTLYSVVEIFKNFNVITPQGENVLNNALWGGLDHEYAPTLMTSDEINSLNFISAFDKVYCHPDDVNQVIKSQNRAT